MYVTICKMYVHIRLILLYCLLTVLRGGFTISVKKLKGEKTSCINTLIHFVIDTHTYFLIPGTGAGVSWKDEMKLITCMRLFVYVCTYPFNYCTIYLPS